MKNSWMRVFGFTFRTTAGGKGYIAVTLTVSLLLLAVIPAVMLIADGISGPDDAVEVPDDIGYAIEDQFYSAAITRAVVVGDTDMSMLAAGEYAGVVFENAADVDEAAAMCAGDEGAVIVVIEGNEIIVLLGDDSGIDYFAAEAFAGHLAYAYPESRADAAAEDVPVYDIVTDTQLIDVDEEYTDADMLQEIVGMIVPYVVVMLMYFMVLIYGQSVANSAIMEKTSKLMDLFLVSVKPSHMMLGKTLATAAAGLIQALCWIFAAVGGCRLGVYLVRMLNPETTLAVISLFEGIGGIAAMFEPAALAVAALMIIAGFVLYCALAGIGGALASKPEDLGSANYLFTMALVISFFACLFSGDSPGMISDAGWMAYVPFTAVLVMPGRLLTGAAPVWQGLVSVGATAVLAVVLCACAGKAYAALAFYRGKPMNPVKLIGNMLKRS